MNALVCLLFIEPKCKKMVHVALLLFLLAAIVIVAALVTQTHEPFAASAIEILPCPSAASSPTGASTSTGTGNTATSPTPAPAPAIAATIEGEFDPQVHRRVVIGNMKGYFQVTVNAPASATCPPALSVSFTPDATRGTVFDIETGSDGVQVYRNGSRSGKGPLYLKLGGKYLTPRSFVRGDSCQTTLTLVDSKAQVTKPLMIWEGDILATWQKEREEMWVGQIRPGINPLLCFISSCSGRNDHKHLNFTPVRI